MEPPVLTPVAEKPKKQMTAAQLESLAKAREKALEVRRAKAAAKKSEVENPPDLKPVYHGEDPPKPKSPVKPTAPEEEITFEAASDSESDDGDIEAEIQRRVAAIRAKDKAKRVKKREKKTRYVIEQSESEEDEGEVLLVRKKPKRPTPPPQSPRPYTPMRPANPFRNTFAGSAFSRF